MHCSTDKLQFNLGDSKCEELTGDDLTSLSSSITKHKLSKVRIHLLSRPKR